MEHQTQAHTGQPQEKLNVPEVLRVGEGTIDIIPGVLRVTTHTSHVGVNVHLEVNLFGWKPIGGATLARGLTRIDLPRLQVGWEYVQLGLELNTKVCEVAVVGVIKLPFRGEDPIRVALKYADPFPTRRPAWNNRKVEQAAVTRVMNEGQHRQGVPGVRTMASDPITREILEGALFLLGADDLIREHIATARQLAQQSTDADGVARDVLIALGISAGGGIGIGVGGGVGLYFTSGGDFGVYGTVQVSLGLIVSISAAAVGTLIWGTRDKPAFDCFTGVSITITGSLTLIEPFPVSVVLYVTPDGQGKQDAVSGVGLALGIGVGSPLEFYSSYAYTFASTPVTRPKQIPEYVDLLLASERMAYLSA